MLRRSLILSILLLLAALPAARAEITLTLGWERPVQFKVIDAETGEAVSRPLLIVETEKVYEGAPQAVKNFEVLRGNDLGLIDYKASEKVPTVGLRVVASGYAMLYKKFSVKELPPRQRDREGFDVGPAPAVVIEMKNLERHGEWKNNFRLNIGPALEEFLEVGPPAMPKEGKKLLADFLNKERDKLLGF